MDNENQGHTKYFNKSGNEVPSCTTIVGLLNKPELIGWANHMGFRKVNVTNFLNKKACFGTECHSIAEQYLTGLMYKDRPTNSTLSDWEYEELLKKLQVIQLFFDQKGISVVNTEMKMQGERYGGTLDLLCRDNEGRFLLFDFKTSKSVYNSHWLQLAGYSMLLKEVHQIDVSKIGIILLSKLPQDKNFLNIVNYSDNEKNNKIFDKLVDIYWIQNS